MGVVGPQGGKEECFFFEDQSVYFIFLSGGIAITVINYCASKPVRSSLLTTSKLPIRPDLAAGHSRHA